MCMDKSRERVLKKLFLEPATYHDASTTKETKNVLCSYDAHFTCSEGQSDLPGRCVLRSDKTLTWAEATAYCRNKGANNVAIHNADENSVFTESLGDSGSAWLQINHGSSWSNAGQTVDYWNWFFDAKTPANLNCSGKSQHAVLASSFPVQARFAFEFPETAKSNCSAHGEWRMDNDDSKNFALCVKPAECPHCPLPPKRADPVPCVGEGKYTDGDGKCSTCPSNGIITGSTCKVCDEGTYPDKVLNQCVDGWKITNESFTSIAGESVPCYVDIRTNGRLTTNGLCRRKGTSKCGPGLIDIAGLCAGTAAVQPTTREYCLSLLMFKTGTCVANEMLLQDAKAPTAIGQYTASIDCASQLTKCECVTSPFGVSIRAGLRSNQVVYFNSADQPVFIGHPDLAERAKQETYCSPPSSGYWPRCNWATGSIGWTRAFDESGCVLNDWKAETQECGYKAIHVSGKGGSACFGYEPDGWVGVQRKPNLSPMPWYRWDGSTHQAGPSEKEWLVLPRVVIVPGDWMPERLGAPKVSCNGPGQYLDKNGACNTCPSNAMSNGMGCKACESGQFPDYALKKCVSKITCDSFTNITGELQPCYCEVRSNGRLTTNGMCRLKGSHKCPTGLTGVAGLCVGANAIVYTVRRHCLSEMSFTTGTCVNNEVLYENAQRPTVVGPYTPSLDCGSQLSTKCGCVKNPYNVSVWTGLRYNQVVYFNAADEPLFVGSCGLNDRGKQETYCATPVDWNYPRCAWATGGVGWTRAWDATGCVENDWRADTIKCGAHAIYIEGKGGAQCFGYEKGGWMSAVNAADTAPWGVWDGARQIGGPTEKDWLALPRTVIVPGNWLPERVK